MRTELDLLKPARRMFDSMLSNLDEELPARLEAGFSPACNIGETDSEFHMSFDIPGVNKEDIKIDVTENRIRVSGERKEERSETKKDRKFYETSFGQFERTFVAPTPIDAAHVQAFYDKGVLQLVIPKSESAKPMYVPIKEGTPTWKGSLKRVM